MLPKSKTKTWHFKFNGQNFCAKLKRNQIWFFFGERKLNDIWYKYKPYIKYEIVEYFTERFYDLRFVLNEENGLEYQAVDFRTIGI